MAFDSTLSSVRSFTSSCLSVVSGVFERHTWAALVLIALVYFPAAFDASRAKPLWHDELFTFYIAQAPSLHALWFDLRHFDLNPPLVYLVTRGSFRIFGINTLATRLPEILAFFVFLLCLFRFARQRLGVLFATFAVAAVLESDIFQLAVEARPYAATLAFLGLALVSWQIAVAQTPAPNRNPHPAKRSAAIAVLALSIACMLLSHIFSVVTMTVVLFAELWRARLRRRLDWPVTLALLAPFALTATYVPMLRNHGGASFPFAFQPTGETIFDFYIQAVARELIAICLSAFAVLLLLGPAHLRGGKPSGPRRWFFSAPEWVAIIWVIAIPLVLLGYLMYTHAAFFPRYGSVATLGVALLTAALLARWTLWRGLPDPSAALLGTIIFLAMSGLLDVIPRQIAAGNLIPTVANSQAHALPCEACQRTAALDPSLPLVDASGLTFIEMNHNESPATLQRVYFLTDPEASEQYAHANIFIHEPEVVRTLGLRGHTAQYDVFLRQHPHFFVFGRYDYPEDWLLRKLVADGANVRVLGRTADSYRDNELYEVWAPPPYPKTKP